MTGPNSANEAQAWIAEHQSKDVLRFLTCGSVDDGKSTLIGRILHDSNMLYEDHMEALQRDSVRHGNVGGGELDMSLLLDGLKAEREQGITIDVAYRYFSTKKRTFIIADTPGHEQYTRNMATGASAGDLAVILVDARHGVVTQTKRHSFIVSLLGIKRVVVAINKMDLVDFSEKRFNEIRAQFEEFRAKLAIPEVEFIPVSALKGDNVVHDSVNMPWYKGLPMLSYLEIVGVEQDRNLNDFRFPVQYVIRPNLDFRGFAGTVGSGVIRKGEEVVALPSGKRSRVKTIVTMDGELEEAFCGQSVTITLEDEIDISRGDLLSKPENQPTLATHLDAMMVWLDEAPLDPKRQYWVRATTGGVLGQVEEIDYGVNPSTWEESDRDALSLNDIARVTVRCTLPLPVDPYEKNRVTGSFILIDRGTNSTVAAGMIEAARREDSNLDRPLTGQERGALLGQAPRLVELVGPVSASKAALERTLLAQGKLARVFDPSAPKEQIQFCLESGLLAIVRGSLANSAAFGSPTTRLAVETEAQGADSLSLVQRILASGGD